MRFILIAACMLTLFCSLPDKRSERIAACEFGLAQNLGPSVNSRRFDGSPTVSADEKTMFFTSGRNGQQDLFVSTRPDRQSSWSHPLNLGDLVNDSTADDFSLRLSNDGKALYFASNRSGGYGAGDLYETTRESAEHGWSRAINLGPVLNTAAFEAFPTPGPDGDTLYFNRSTMFDSQDSDIFVTTRTNAQAPWEPPQRLPMPVNGPRAEFSPSISADGLSLYFASDRSGNLGSIDIWVSTRKRLADAWESPKNLGSKINPARAMTLAPYITADNRALYFMSARPHVSSESECTPRTCFDRLDLYVAVVTCPQ